MLRKRNDSVKSGKGIDEDLGEDFVKPGPDQQFGYPGGTKGGSEGNGREPSDERSVPGAYTENKSGLTRGKDFQFGASSRDIFDDVIANSDVRGDDVNANTGPIKFGVNRRQSDK